jgi:hypothetical protein
MSLSLLRTVCGNIVSILEASVKHLAAHKKRCVTTATAAAGTAINVCTFVRFQYLRLVAVSFVLVLGRSARVRNRIAFRQKCDLQKFASTRFNFRTLCGPENGRGMKNSRLGNSK